MATLTTLIPPTPTMGVECSMNGQDSSSDGFQLLQDDNPTDNEKKHQKTDTDTDDEAQSNGSHQSSCNNEDLNADTVTASNVSNLRLQLAASTQHLGHNHNENSSFVNHNNRNPSSASNLSLRDLFTDPKEDDNHTDSGSTTNHSTKEGELWEYDGGSSLELEEADEAEERQEAEPAPPPPARSRLETPPDSLHQRKRPEPSSSLVLLQRDKLYHPPGLSTPPTNPPPPPQDSSDSPYSSPYNSGGDSSSTSSSFRRSYSPGEPHTVLYSAIGSLEDPSNGSFKWSKQRNQVPKYTVPKFEVPKGLLLAPLSALNQQQQGLLAAGSTATTTTTGAITVLEPQPVVKTLTPSAKPADDDVETDEKKPKPNVSNKDRAAVPSKGSVEKKPSNLRKTPPPSSSSSGDLDTASAPPSENKKVQISRQAKSGNSSSSNTKRKGKKKIEMFRPSCDAYTPRMGKREIKYKPAEQRTPVVQKMASGLGTLSRPNFRDALRRVAMIIQQHIVKIERRFEAAAAVSPSSSVPTVSNTKKKRGIKVKSDKLFNSSMKEEFSEDRYITPTYKCTMVRVPMARPGMVYGLKQIRHEYEIPSEQEIYDFAHRLFKTVQLSSECSIVCLIYVERLMEEGKVPLLASTWRPIFLTGLLLASKVWQDLSSWNIEFTNVYPQFSLQAIAQLEVKFLRILKWDLYIKSSQYAKYYFALRSLVEKQDFRQRYNRMVGGVDKDALKVEERSGIMKEEALLHLSRSM